MQLTINSNQMMILKSLLEEEIRYLTDDAIPNASLEEDVIDLNSELNDCKDIMNQLNDYEE